MNEIKTGCGTCGSNSDDDEGVVPEAYSVSTAPMPVPAQGREVACSIKPIVSACATKPVVNQCSCCPTPDQPIGGVKLMNTVPMPACQMEADLEFDADISKLPAGLNLWATGVGFLRISSILGPNKIRAKNLCEGNILSPGESIIAGTQFSWGIPYAPVQGSGSSNNVGPFLDEPGFIVPVIGSCNAARVKNPAGLATGQVVSLAGYNYRISAQIDAFTFAFCNDNNGAVANSAVEADGNGDGTLDWPIVVQDQAEVCTGSSVGSGVLIACTNSGQKKLVGTSRADVPRWNPSIAQWAAEALFASQNTGPHYVSFNATTKEWTLVYAPDLLGGDCTKLKDGINLDPDNTSNLYSPDVESTAGMAPGAVLKIGGLDFDLVTVLTAGTPGKVRLRPRFSVTSVQTIAAGTSVCISISQCPPFAGSSYPSGIGAIVNGSPVFCSADGLRTFPPMRSTVGAAPLDLPSPVNINAAGDYDSANLAIVITNPSSILPAHVHLNFSSRAEYTLNSDGSWRHEILRGDGVPATTAVKSLRHRMPGGLTAADQWVTGSQIVYNEVFGLTAGETKTINFKVRIKTVNASVETPAASWDSLDASCHFSVNSYLP